MEFMPKLIGMGSAGIRRDEGHREIEKPALAARPHVPMSPEPELAKGVLETSIR
jgi:hypothetical protein